MARSSFQKLKLLHVMNYLLQNSDEEHPITVNQMIQYLESNGIAAERKSIYDDIEALRTFGMDIEECKRGRVFGYYVASRTFELPERSCWWTACSPPNSSPTKRLRPSSRRSNIGQRTQRPASAPAGLCEKPHQDHERVHLTTMDEIHNGISKNRKIRFLYFEYNVAKSGSTPRRARTM